MRVRHCIPRGVAEPLFGMARGADLPQGKTGTKIRRRDSLRVSRRTHGQVCEGFLRDTSLKRSGNAPDRYPLFFAKLFFHPKKKRGGFWWKRLKAREKAEMSEK